ncbi:MAG: sigma factor-like helix-turn-helix DNA-binding protein, partial [Chloroflexota bacterium]
RETYVGPWLPEPLVSDAQSDPQGQTVRAEAISMAFLVLMEELSPEQRAAFLLREVFDYDYVTIATILRKSQANARQLVSRARRRVRGNKEISTTSLQEQIEIADTFWGALQEGDVQGVLNLLAEDVIWWSDGGGKAPAARRPIEGAQTVAKFLFNLMKMAPEDLVIRRTVINGRPGLILYTSDKAFNTISVEVVNGRIASFWAVLNPDKLTSLPALEA